MLSALSELITDACWLEVRFVLVGGAGRQVYGTKFAREENLVPPPGFLDRFIKVASPG